MPNRIKELRKKKNLTQTDLAKIVGVSLKTLQNWERGDNEMNLKSAIELSEALEVEVKELTKASIEKNKKEIRFDEPEISVDDQLEKMSKRVKDLEKLNANLQEALIRAMDKL